jgi:hypothetical protein
MPDKRVTVWVQHFKDRSTLVLQWLDPDTGRRKSKSAGTADPKEAEILRADLEADLNHGRHRETSRMSWERFRELFEQEFLPNRRPNTRRNYRVALDLFEKHCRPSTLRSISERTLSAFTAALWKQPGRGNPTMLASTIRVRVQFLQTVFAWAAGQKLIPECPKLPVVKVPKRKPQPVPSESFERLLTRCPTRWFSWTSWLSPALRTPGHSVRRACSRRSASTPTRGSGPYSRAKPTACSCVTHGSRARARPSAAPAS